MSAWRRPCERTKIARCGAVPGIAPFGKLPGFTASMDVGLALEEEGASAVDASLLPQQCCVLSAPGDSPGAFGPRRPRCEFYLIGTAHVSANSCEDVRRVIQLVRPEVRNAPTL